ncbi:hypothetical protein OGAPHI_004447 [Ogataea philodendri]|uniref:Uncharacterized protein n=1 Tax=Ogataea philodendri TaxID=1378263 RepID=A0A9P8T4S8_9ASCO|nr:uncharacterized protein OGAPHI_004447 [Ogataea philodendri]KAH3666258.1 hypothetical protein OGAPHI_004447 [Ogataea philodendri]
MNCKFFGALTYTVNLNFHTASLVNDQDSVRLLEIRATLIDHLISLISDESVLRTGLFVIKKMFSNLSLLFLNSNGTWENPLLTFISSVAANRATESTISLEELDSLLISMPWQNIWIFTIFSQIIAEDLVKKETTSLSNVQTHNLVHRHLFPTTEKLMVVSSKTSGDHKLVVAWLECLSAWANYASKAEFDSTERYNMANLLSICISLITNSDFSITEKAIETLSEILEINPTFFNSNLKSELQSLLFGNVGVQYVSYFSSQNDEKSVCDFARLIIAFLDSDLSGLVLKLNDDKYSHVFDFLVGLTDFPGVAIDEENVSKEFADFWLRFADYCLVEDTTLQALMEKDPASYEILNDKVKMLFNKITQIYWKKAHVPEDVAHFKQEFALYRRDIGDLFESVYPLIKLPLVVNLLSTVHSSLQTGDLDSIEPSLFLANYISKDFGEEGADSQLIDLVSLILDASLLPTVLQSKSNEFKYLINSTIQFFSTADWFYKTQKGSTYLPQILGFLFDCMINSNVYQLTSSKAIADICNECRFSLVEFLPSFETIISEMISNISVDSLVRQRIINSYASIIQGVKNPVIQGENLKKLFDLLDSKSMLIIPKLDAANAEEREVYVDYLTSLISCVSAVGKGMQLPEEVDGYYTEEQEAAVREYWDADPLALHDKLLTIVRNFNMTNQILSDNYSILEETVNLFKYGLTETISGPFVIDYTTILQFIVTKSNTLQKPNALPLLFSLLGSIIVAHYRTIDRELLNSTIDTIFTSKMAIVEDDPDLVQSSLNLFGSMLTVQPSLLIGNEPLLTILLQFGVRHLQSNERFVLKAIEKFWTRIITLRKGDRQDTMAMRRIFNETELGYVLTFNVLKYMFATQRSNLETFIEIIKQLVAKYPLMMSKWLNDSFPKLNQERAKKIDNWEIFVKKILLTRGTREYTLIWKKEESSRLQSVATKNFHQRVTLGKEVHFGDLGHREPCSVLALVAVNFSTDSEQHLLERDVFVDESFQRVLANTLDAWVLSVVLEFQKLQSRKSKQLVGLFVEERQPHLACFVYHRHRQNVSIVRLCVVDVALLASPGTIILLEQLLVAAIVRTGWVAEVVCLNKRDGGLDVEKVRFVLHSQSLVLGLFDSLAVQDGLSGVELIVGARTRVGSDGLEGLVGALCVVPSFDLVSFFNVWVHNDGSSWNQRQTLSAEILHSGTFECHHGANRNVELTRVLVPKTNVHGKSSLVHQNNVSSVERLTGRLGNNLLFLLHVFQDTNDVDHGASLQALDLVERSKVKVQLWNVGIVLARLHHSIFIELQLVLVFEVRELRLCHLHRRLTDVENLVLLQNVPELVCNLVESSGSDLSGLVQQVHVEQLSVSSLVGPVLHVALKRNSGLDGPRVLEEWPQETESSYCLWPEPGP